MENKTIQNSDLEKIAGGNEVQFLDGEAVCPICGKYPIRLVSADEFTDTYQCDVCGHMSTHHKSASNTPESNQAVCPRCGNCSSFRLVKSENGLNTLECRLCGMHITVSAANQ